MTEYIEREAALEIINSLNIASALYAGRKIINLPPADVAPVRHGRWIETGRGLLGADSYKCSECEQPMPFYNGYKYCPNCGAKMMEG